MTTFQRISGTAKADFLERVRNFSFLAFAALIIFAVFWFVPRSSGFTALVIEPERFIQGSDPSWIPMSSAMCGGMLLCLLGFAYIKNTVAHDFDIGIFQFVQVSPLKRSTYLFGKFFSNVLLLLLFLGFIMAASFVIMVIRFPGRFISLYAFFSPFFCVVPGLFFVAAFALLTDCAPLFRRNSGLSIAVFFCFFVLILTLGSLNRNPYRLTSIFDFSGYMWIHDSISSTAAAVTGQSAVHISVFTNSHEAGSQLKVLAFHGVTPSAAYLIDKLILVVISLILTFFTSFLLPISQTAIPSKATKVQDSKDSKKASTMIPFCHFGLVHSEMVILLKGRSNFWWIFALCLWIANIFSPMDTVQGALFPLAFAWLLPVLSGMGCMEHQIGMDSILYTISRATFRHVFSCWQTGLIISFFTALPVLLRLLFCGQYADFLSVLIFTVFFPSAALFLGKWTKSNRPAEILLLTICFLIMNLPTLVFPGNYFTAPSGMRIGCFILIIGTMLFLTFGKSLVPHLETN